MRTIFYAGICCYREEMWPEYWEQGINVEQQQNLYTSTKINSFFYILSLNRRKISEFCPGKNHCQGSIPKIAKYIFICLNEFLGNDFLQHINEALRYAMGQTYDSLASHRTWSVYAHCNEDENKRKNRLTVFLCSFLNLFIFESPRSSVILSFSLSCSHHRSQ